MVPEPGRANRKAPWVCQRCGEAPPVTGLKLCGRCGRDLTRRCLAYQVIHIAGLGAGRKAIAVRVGVN